MDFSMRIFDFCFRPIEMDFSMRVFVFLISGLLKIDFSMRIFVFLASGIVEDGAVPVFSFQFIMCLGPDVFFQ